MAHHTVNITCDNAADPSCYEFDPQDLEVDREDTVSYTGENANIKFLATIADPPGIKTGETTTIKENAPLGIFELDVEVHACNRDCGGPGPPRIIIQA